MTMTAMQMIVDAKVQVGSVAPEVAAGELASEVAVFVDVREPEEWLHGHIEGSVSAPRGLLEFIADPTSPRHDEALDPAKRTIVVCASGARAEFGGADAQDNGLRRFRRPRRRYQGMDERRIADHGTPGRRDLVPGVGRTHEVSAEGGRGSVAC